MDWCRRLVKANGAGADWSRRAVFAQLVRRIPARLLRV